MHMSKTGLEGQEGVDCKRPPSAWEAPNLEECDILKGYPPEYSERV